MKLEYPSFGRIVVDGRTYEHDIVIYPSGRVEKRKKWLSKNKHGTSHKLDPDELREYLREDFEVLIVGTGYYGYLSLLPESRELVRDKEVYELPIGKAVELFNELNEKKRVLGIFHVTC
ncbi:MAG: Mth938-like domain-containing protein [Thermococcus sp.]